MNGNIHVWFGKGSSKILDEWKDNLFSLSGLLDNRKLRILNSFQNSENLIILIEKFMKDSCKGVLLIS